MNAPKKPNFVSGLIINFIFVSAITTFLVIGYKVGGGTVTNQTPYQLFPVALGVAFLLTYLGYRK